jgi:hypothetical protein
MLHLVDRVAAADGSGFWHRKASRFRRGLVERGHYNVAHGRLYISTDQSGRGVKRVYDTLGRVLAIYPLDTSGDELSATGGGYVSMVL